MITKERMANILGNCVKIFERMKIIMGMKALQEYHNMRVQEEIGKKEFNEKEVGMIKMKTAERITKSARKKRGKLLDMVESDGT